MSAQGSRKRCFVIMGFGKKTDFETGRMLDLDKSYKNIIKPAVEAAGLECARTDEIVHSGVIDMPMFEQLLSADLVIADLSTWNRNSLYELGIRHALRPYGTIVIAEDGLRSFPFDTNHVKVMQYHHLGQDIGYDEIMRVRELLTKSIKDALANADKNESVPDSPVYSFLKDLQPPAIRDAASQAKKSSDTETASASRISTVLPKTSEPNEARAKVSEEARAEKDATSISRVAPAMRDVGEEIFISYAWGDESEAIANKLDKAFQARGVTIVRDKRDLGFKGRIKGFMESIGGGRCVILVISEKYLKSENCLFELLQVAKQGDFSERIFPVVLGDALIYRPVDRIRYVQYWEKQLEDLDTAMRSVSSVNLQGFREDIDLYAEIRTHLPRLSDILKDMNALTSQIQSDSGFAELFEAVMKKLTE